MGAVISTSWHRLRRYLNLTETHMDKPMEKKVEKQNEVGSKEKLVDPCTHHMSTSLSYNSNPFDALEWRKPILGNVLEALANPNIHLIGVYGLHDEIKGTLFQRVYRRIQRDNLFDMVLTATATRKPDARKIQEEIAHQLVLKLDRKSKDRRANELIHRIKNEKKILIVPRDLYKELNLGKVGIPFGADHTGCKILLTSTNEEVLSKHMHTQLNFMV